MVPQTKLLTASGRVLSMGQWSKTSSVREVSPVKLGHHGGRLAPWSPSQLQSLNARLRSMPSCPRPAGRGSNGPVSVRNRGASSNGTGQGAAAAGLSLPLAKHHM